MASRRATAMLWLVLGPTSACARRGADTTPEGPVTELQAEARVREAIRRSSEGVILLPSKKAERVFELPRLNDIAQALRQPFAVCFLKRAIMSMTPKDEGLGFEHVPEGQAKVRARIGADGRVMRAEVLDSGFADEEMEACLTTVVRHQRFPDNDSGHTHYIDVVYWVSLGVQGDIDRPQYAEHVRRESVAAAIRAKPCLQGRVDAGAYVVDGLNLVDREGTTLINRVQQDDLPESVRSCIATAFQEIRLGRQPDAFVRPVATKVTFDVTRDGTIGVDGEEWLRLLELEEAAQRAEQARAEGDEGEPLRDELDEDPRRTAIGLGVAAPDGRTATAATPIVTDSGPPARPLPPPETPRADPGEGGLRLDLGGRGDD